MNYLANRSFTGIVAALGALIFFVMLNACTEVDDRLGASLVPGNQRMNIEVASPENSVNTYLFREDSVPSSRTGRAYFGRTVDPEGVFGGQTSSALLQMIPYALPYDNIESFGMEPIVDSAVILFVLADTRGDTTQVQRFDVWEVDDSREAVLLHRDSTYYTNFPIDRFKGRKLFEFSHKGKRDVEARLFPTAAGKEYLDKMVSLEWKNYTSDSLFQRTFRGLYITPSEGSPSAAALYGVDLASSGLQLYGRNHDSLDLSAIYDTISVLFTFRDTNISSVSEDEDGEQISTTWANVSVNMATFDYTGSALGVLEGATNGFTDTLPTSATQSTLYVQPLGGVGAQLRFTDELVDYIRNLKSQIDETGEMIGKGRDIAINQAVMKIWIEDPSVSQLDASISRLGSYLDIKTLTPIPDYYYQYETYQNEQYQSIGSSEVYSLPYGGYLNRSNGYYEMDITSYIQQLSKIKEDDPEYMYVQPSFRLAPEAYGIAGSDQTILQGTGSDRPVSIRITYTIIER
jgi:hypothetical protein